MSGLGYPYYTTAYWDQTPETPEQEATREYYWGLVENRAEERAAGYPRLICVNPANHSLGGAHDPHCYEDWEKRWG